MRWRTIGRWRRWRRSLACVAAGFCLSLWLALPAAAAAPSVLLILLDDLGLQLSAYGDTTQETPSLDALAGAGVRFTNAYVTQSSCSSSRSSLLTGAYPHQTGQIGLAHLGFAMDRAYPTIPSILKTAGYRTGVIGKVHVQPDPATQWSWRADHQTWPDGTRDVRRVAAAAAGFLADAEGQPFFLQVSLLDPHEPWLDQVQGIPEQPLTADDISRNAWTGEPVAAADKPAIAAFYNSIRRADTGVGLLLQALADAGRAADTIVIAVGDNGPEAVQGGPATEPGGKADIFEASLRVPLLIRYPGAGPTGQVRRELVSIVDLLPTILAAADVAVPAETRAMMTEGQSLLPILAGQTEASGLVWRTYLFAEMTYHTPDIHRPSRSLRGSRYKLIRTYPPFERGSGGLMLFDLAKDPHETINRVDDPALTPVRRRLLRQLDAWQERTDDPLLTASRSSGH